MSVRSNGSVFAVLFGATVVAALGGCRSWDEAREEFVEPFNRFVHHELPEAYQAHSIEAFSGIYADELLEDTEFRGRLTGLLARFGVIEDTLAIIRTVEFLDGERRVRAEVKLVLNGTSPAGVRTSQVRVETLVCQRQDDSTPAGWRIVETTLIREDLIATAEPVFREVAQERGLHFTHVSGGVVDRWLRVQPYTPGAGLAVADYNGDGWEDVLFVNGKASQLFANRSGRFTDVTESAGLLPYGPGEGRCAVFADYDNDGDADLFVGLLNAPDQLYRNNGDGTFSEHAAAAGLSPSGETTGACFADFNKDGLLDLYIANGGNLLHSDPEPIYQALNATPNQLLVANGDGTFRDVTETAGVGHGGWALCCSAVDYDLDGDVDIFIGNDFGFDVLYSNRGDGVFDEVTWEAGFQKRGATMSADWGDVNNDGIPDLFTGGMSSNSRWILGHPSFPAPAPWPVSTLFRDTVLRIFSQMLHGNFLYTSGDEGGFNEISSLAGVHDNGWAWSSIFLDYDNDGYLDVYSTNGFLSGEDPQDL